jgi:DNA-3-methyladenine glycosylase II
LRKAIHHRAIHHLKKSDAVLAEIIEGVGPCLMQFGEPTFHTLAESILYQQLNGKAAATIFNRFTALAGDPLTPQGILKLTDSEMRGVGLSRQKTSYLRDLSAKTAAGLLEFERLSEMSEEEVIAHLTQVKGVGVWTSHMFLMFTLRHPDILPVGDYGVQAAIKKHYKKRKWPKPVSADVKGSQFGRSRCEPPRFSMVAGQTNAATAPRKRSHDSGFFPSC